MPRQPIPTLLVALAVLVLGGCVDGDEAASPPATDQTDGTDQTEETDGASGDDGAADVSTVPQLVRDITPSVVAVLAGQGVGSGVIYEADGLIVTNDHVVAEAGPDGVEVVLADGDRVPAEVVAGDARTDIAVLRVDRTGLPTADFAEDLPDVGELVIAVGNPLGFESSVSQGIISGLQRTLPGPEGQALVDLIQTDAAMSPGNSGGPLVDGSGDVVGINVAFIPPQLGAVSLGFAIPSTTVTDVVSQLLETGQVRHPFLGVQTVPVAPEVAERFDLGIESGVLVLDVVEGSPAADAGIEGGDVIVGVAGEEVRSMRDFLAAVSALEPGDDVEVALVRDGEELTVPVTIGERPA